MIWGDCSQKTNDSLEIFWLFFLFCMPDSESLLLLFAHSLFFKERLERFTPVMTKEWPGAIRSGRSLQKSGGRDSLFFRSESLFCSLAHKKEWIGRKTVERIPNPASRQWQDTVEPDSVVGLFSVLPYAIISSFNYIGSFSCYRAVLYLLLFCISFDLIKGKRRKNYNFEKHAI